MMAQTPFSRRDFLSTLASSGAGIGLSQAVSADGTAHPHRAAGAPPADDQPIQVICTEKLSAAEAGQIRQASPRVALHLMGEKGAEEHLAEARVILGRVDANLLRAARQVQWVQTWAAGVETLPRELFEHPCVLTNMQRVFAPVIAETAIGLLLSLTRGLAQVSIPAFAGRQWRAAPPGVPLDDLYGKTVGMVGMGGIGSETARRLHYGFGMRVLATEPKPLPKPEYVAELREPGWLMEMVPQVDVLMSAAPLTPETKLLFNAAVFRKMKPTAYFINVTRGGLVDQDALVKALQEKWFRGAGLDVATPEPLPADSPLWNCPNLVITPHNSGNAPVRQVRLMALVTENVRRYCHGLPLLNVVDKQKGY
ncbi:MAG: D-2-hydroxyacid dehydrogenase [Cytophagales bacterium]|nr:D-2-hydroxyacid dehydrogenase [Cytophagales bacterium]